MAEDIMKQEKKDNIFVRFGKGFVNFFTKSIPNFFTKSIPNLGRRIGKWFVEFGKRFKDGSVGTKCSHLIFGAGNLYHGQIIKGLIYLALQVLFVLYMVLCPAVSGPNGIQVPTGWKSLANLKLGGNPGGTAGQWTPSGEFVPGDYSLLFLLLGLVTIAVIILYIIVWLSSIKSSYLADTAVKEGRKPSSFKEDCAALLDNRFHILMLTPTCLAALIFTVLPTIMMICIGFTDWNGTDALAAGTNVNIFHWNGFANFGAVFSGSSEYDLGREISARFFPVLGWTFLWAILATFTCYFGGIILAILINKKGLWGKKIFRTIFILTIAIPQFISLLVMRNLFDINGPINEILKNLGMAKSINFLGQDTTDPNVYGANVWVVRLMIILVNMWLGIPYTMLMTSGILMNIPADLYEAARVDGTSNVKMFFKITLPYVIFITTPYLISSFVGNINSFNTIFLLTNGGPVVTDYQAGQTDLLVTWLYKLTVGKDPGDFNTGSVIGLFTFLITATITLVSYRRSKAYNEEDTFQ